VPRVVRTVGVGTSGEFEVADLNEDRLDRMERQMADAHDVMDRLEAALAVRAEAALQHARHVLEPLREVG
jgi:hypothetical protein